jgi:hypothetical protein
VIFSLDLGPPAAATTAAVLVATPTVAGITLNGID